MIYISRIDFGAKHGLEIIDLLAKAQTQTGTGISFGEVCYSIHTYLVTKYLNL